MRYEICCDAARQTGFSVRNKIMRGSDSDSDYELNVPSVSLKKEKPPSAITSGAPCLRGQHFYFNTSQSTDIQLHRWVCQFSVSDVVSSVPISFSILFSIYVTVPHYFSLSLSLSHIFPSSLFKVLQWKMKKIIILKIKINI